MGFIDSIELLNVLGNGSLLWNQRTPMSVDKLIHKILIDHSSHFTGGTCLDVPLFKKISQKVRDHHELIFLLPAFPAKSPSPSKTMGELPDLGEVLALQNLQ